MAHILRTWPFAALVSIVAGCGGNGTGDADLVGTVVAQVTVTPDGGVVTEGDVQISIPPGAVAEDTLITIEAFTAAAALDELAMDLDLDPASGALRFSSDHEILLPFAVRVRTEQDTLATGIDFAVHVPIALPRGGVAEVAGSPRTEADDATGDVHLQFEVDPAHVVVGEQEGGFYVIARSDLFVTVETTMPGQSVPPQAAVGDVVDTKIVLMCVEGGGLVPSGAGTVSLEAPGWEAQGGTAGGPVQFGAALQEHKPDCLYHFGDKRKRTRTSGTEVAWLVTTENAWHTKGGTPILSEGDQQIFGSSEVLAKKFEAIGVGPLVKADQISVSPAALYNISRANDTLLYVGTAPDLAILLAEDETIDRTVGSGLYPNPTIGAIPLTTRPDFWFSKASLAATAPDVDALFSYGNSGFSIRHWLPDINDFGASEIDPGSGSVSDADTFEEDKGRAVVVQSGRNQVRFVEYVTDPFPPFNARFTMVDVLQKGIASSLFPGATGYVISAARRTDTSPVYFVTVGATPDDPGSLWRKDDPTDRVKPATLVGSVGNAPRRIRFLKTIGIVSNSFSDTLTILVRDASDNVTIKGTVPAGDGPIGIGLIELPDGNIGVASAGFLDNTYTITILEPDGDVVSNVTTPVPGGGQKPACAAFANAEGTKIAVSCSGSDEVFIIPID